MTNLLRAAFIFSSLLAGAAPVCAKDSGMLREVSGVVQVQNRGAEGWVLVRRVPLPLSAGDRVRTGYGARAVLDCSDGSRLELGGSAAMTLVEDSRYRVAVELEGGPLKAEAKADPLRSFQLRTPAALATLRGAKVEVSLEVRLGGRTVIDLHKGLLGVEDRHGAAVLLHPNERLEVDAAGMGRADPLPAPRERRRLRFHELMQRELALDQAQDIEQSAAAREIKLAEYQQGKAFIDLNGVRVRVEEFMLRPAADQFKLVVLNGHGSSLGYFYSQGTFNRNLPADLSVPFSQLAGRSGTAPDYWLTAFQTGRSNGVDSVVEMGQGGHPVDLNGNAEPGDDVAWLFDRDSGAYVSVAGQPVFQTLFDRYGLYVNGGLKHGWSGVNLQSREAQQAALSTTNDPITGALLPGLLPVRGVNTTYPSGGAEQLVTESYNDGTFIQWRNRAFDFGGAAAVPGGAGPAFKAGLARWGFQQTITASEFGGRSIDLVIAPKVLLQSELLP
ncbi:MAG: FecR domain-containing protein [Elusimicrobia bacterium]|nr:FecR domain-containing protein [Elusimicrobiota bacterium]